MEPKLITVKEPFKRVLPYTQRMGVTVDGEKIPMEFDGNTWEIINQEKLISELSPSGHKINNRPDKRINDKDGNFLKLQSVAKIAVPFQKIIATKQKIHLATKDIKFTLTEKDRTEAKENTFIQFKQAWKEKNMQVALSKCIGSWLETGDTALYFYRNDNKLGWKEFGFKNGDLLFPHYDYYDNLDAFGRMYRSVNAEGKSITKLDVFDKKEIITYIKRGAFGSTFMGEWKQDGDPKAHGFSDIPICYKRSNDACWGDVQPLIDSYEESVSSMSENNRYYANAILFITGQIKDLPGRDESAKILQGGVDSKAQFLSYPESNSAMAAELKILAEHIFMGSFTVSISPDTVKSSGDLPGITVKLLFSPAVEKALDSAKELDEFIDRAVMLFKEGYGIESGSSLSFKTLKLRGEIDIYVPQNDAELIRTLNESIGYGSLSKETGAEVNPLGINGEHKRIKEQIASENAGSNDIITNTVI